MGNKLSYPEEDLSGKVAVVTGGNTGIGYETAKALARLGAHTFIACRSKERAEAAIERMKTELGAGGKKEADVPEGKKEPEAEGKKEPAEGKDEGAEREAEKKDDKAEEGAAEEKQEGEEKSETPAVKEGATGTEGKEGSEEAAKNKDGASEVQAKPKKEIKVEFLPLDLSSFQSTTDFVRAFKEKNLPLHILINNAAVAWIPFRLTGDGYEEQFQVNHLGPLLLTLELLPVLLETAGTSGDVRIVFVSSGAHKQALPFNVEQLVVKEEAQYNRLRTYPNTKLYNVMVGYALQRRIPNQGITVSSLEPGYVKTELARGWEDKSILAFINKIGYSAIARTPVEGAATTINCAVNPALNTQQCLYYASCKALLSISQARVENNQEQLWQKSIEILKDCLSRDILDKYGEAHVETPPAASQAPAADEASDKPANVTTPSDEKPATPPADKPSDKTTPPADEPTDKPSDEATSPDDAKPPADKPTDEA